MNVPSCIDLLGFILATVSMSGCTENKKSSIKQGWWTEPDYQSNHPPDGNVTVVYKTITYCKVIDVKERDREIELDMKAQLMWEDYRIRTSFTSVEKKNGRLTLPSWSSMKGLLWMPTTHISDLSKIKTALGELSLIHI